MKLSFCFLFLPYFLKHHVLTKKRIVLAQHSSLWLIFLITKLAEINTITPVIAVLIGVVGSFVFTAIAIMIVAKVKGFDADKGNHQEAF